MEGRQRKKKVRQRWTWSRGAVVQHEEEELGDGSPVAQGRKEGEGVTQSPIVDGSRNRGITTKIPEVVFIVLDRISHTKKILNILHCPIHPTNFAI
jgi:hypothetical protein